MLKLAIPPGQAERLRADAARIVDGTMRQVLDRTTDTVERATARLMGVDGLGAEGEPRPNLLVRLLRPVIADGIAFRLANGVARTGREPDEVVDMAAGGRLDLAGLPVGSVERVVEVAGRLVRRQLDRIVANRARRAELIACEPVRGRPLLYVIVATGNVYEDAVQARIAAEGGADVVAVIRSTAQSLLDFVPYGATTEGFGGTWATQENFRIVRAALDLASENLGRYVRQVNYASGLCMPEIAVMGALERLDMMLNDSMYGILFRDINIGRTFVDQHFSRMVNAYAGIVINTGEDNYLTTADAVEAFHTVIASDLINEQFAVRAGLAPAQMGLGHAFEIDPEVENSFSLELAHALTVRALFPDAPVKYMPPTKHVGGDIYATHIIDGMFNLASVMTGQGIHLLGMPTEAIHTPWLHDRHLSLRNAGYVMRAARDLGDQFELKPDSLIARRAALVLERAGRFLAEVAESGLTTAIEEGRFADIRRARDGGRGADGVHLKSERYYNPLYEVFRRELGVDPGREGRP